MSSEAVLAMRNVSQFFGAGALRRQVLFDVSAHVLPGEIVGLTVEADAYIVSISPVPNSEGPGAPSAWLGTIIGTGGSRHRIDIPGPQQRGTGGTVGVVGNDHRDRCEPPSRPG
jgi:hypothetical protein